MREEVEKRETEKVSIIEAVAERCRYVRPFYSPNPRSSQSQGVVQTGRTQASHRSCCSVHRLGGPCILGSTSARSRASTRSQRCPRTRSSMSWVLGVQCESAEGRSRGSSARLASIDALDNGHFFQDAKTGGWMDAVLSSARSHPGAIRTMEYWEQCDEIWASNLPDPYPSFRSWRRQVDSYVVSMPDERSQLAC